MAKRNDEPKEGDVLFELQSVKRGLEAVKDAASLIPGDLRVAPQATAKWKEPYAYHPLFLEVEIYPARLEDQDCWLLLKQHDFIGYYISEAFVISKEYGQQLIERHSGKSENGKLSLKIIIKKRGHDCHACIEGHPGIWEAGKTGAEAVGKLIQIHGKTLGIEIQWSDETWTQRYLAGDPLTKS